MVNINNLTLKESKIALKKALKRIAELELEIQTIVTQRKLVIKSANVQDKFTHLTASELRVLIIKQNHDPEEVTKGFHSRQRSIKMREWLRSRAKTKKKTRNR